MIDWDAIENSPDSVAKYWELMELTPDPKTNYKVTYKYDDGRTFTMNVSGVTTDDTITSILNEYKFLHGGRSGQVFCVVSRSR